jgi:hypothetical protein
MSLKNLFTLTVLYLCLMGYNITTYAQDLEPRAYANAPVGMNFILTGYQHSEGALLFDPSLPVTDANAKVDMGIFGYVRTLDVADKSAKAGVILPYALLSADGYVANDYRSREVDGLADPVFYFSMNLQGAPALSVQEFKSYKQNTIVGFTLKLSAPLGQYDENKLLNIGTNRWSLKPEIGLSKAFGRWRLEGAAGVTFFTDNDDFDNGSTREQDPIYAVQAHIVHSFANHIWASVGATYFTGGKTTIDGIEKNDQLENWRTGFTLSLPVNRNHSMKVFGNSGVSTRTGTDYDSLGVAWQYRWVEGL